jgi:hypothetical protein
VLLFRKREVTERGQEKQVLVHMHQNWWCISSSNQLEKAGRGGGKRGEEKRYRALYRVLGRIFSS